MDWIDPVSVWRQDACDICWVPSNDCAVDLLYRPPEGLAEVRHSNSENDVLVILQEHPSIVTDPSPHASRVAGNPEP